MKYVLSPGWKVEVHNNALSFSNELFIKKISNLNNADEIFKSISKNEFNPDQIDEHLCKYLLENKIIRINEKHPPLESHLKYEKQIDFWRYFNDNPYICHQKLRQKKISIIGLGGVGSIVLEILAGAGVKNFTLVDTDKVELSNFNRQYIYQSEDIGSFKVDAASNNIKKKHDNLNIEKYLFHYPSDNFNSIIKESDFIVSAIDHPSFKAAMRLSQECWENKIPSAFAACGVYKSVISPIFDKKMSHSSPLETCSFINGDSNHTTSPISASSGGWNSIVSSILSEQILLHLAGIHEETNYYDYTYIKRSNGRIKINQSEKIML